MRKKGIKHFEDIQVLALCLVEEPHGESEK